MDQQEDEENQDVIRQRKFLVLLYILLGLCVTSAVTSFIFFQSNLHCYLRENFLPLLLSAVMCITVATTLFNYTASKNVKLSLYLSNCALTSMLLVNVPPPILAVSIAYTILIIFILLLMSLFVLSREASKAISKPLATVNVFFVVCSLYLLFFNSDKDEMTDLIELVTLYGGGAVYSGLFMCNIHRLLENIPNRSFDLIFTTSVIYSTIMNILSRVITVSSREFYFFRPERK